MGGGESERGSGSSPELHEQRIPVTAIASDGALERAEFAVKAKHAREKARIRAEEAAAVESQRRAKALRARYAND